MAHGFSENRHQFVEKWLVKTERPPITDSAAEDAAEHVISIVVARLNAVGNRKTEGADMVSNDTERYVI